MLGKAFYEKIKANRQAKIDKEIAKGESNVIDALTKISKDSNGKITLLQAIEKYKAKKR